MERQTIAAVATAPGTSGVAVVRISGPQSAAVLQNLCGKLPMPRMATFCELRVPATGERLDTGLALWFPGPASFTGEDVAEFQIHGGRAVVAAVLQAVLSGNGIRVAEPGEFTRRAFENGKLDLSEVEGLGDLISAETEAQRRQAYAHFRGRVASAIEDVRDRLIGILSLVEATIDFPDEGDVASSALDQARMQAQALIEVVDRLLADGARGERIREGITIAIAGPPNAGKSTLLNAMARRDVAIVSPVAGTTRDSIEVHLDLGGVAVVLVDTAGLRDSDDAVEREGVARARKRISEADLTLWLSPARESVPEGVLFPRPVWSIRTQIDRFPDGPRGGERHAISARSGVGMSALLADLSKYAGETAGGEPAVIVRERHRLVFEDVRSALIRAHDMKAWDEHAELVAESLRSALGVLGRATGRIGSEEILDQLFSAFCIGK